MNNAAITNVALATVLDDLATAVPALSERRVRIPIINPFTVITPLDLSSREGSSVYQLIYAPLDKIWDGTAENFISFVT